MLDETADQIRPVPQSCNSQAQFMAEFILVMATDVSQLNILQVIPDPFVRVQIGRIARQLRHADLPGSARRQEGLDGLVPVDGRTIPDDQYLAANMAQQMLQEAHDLWSFERVRLHLDQQLPMPGDPADDREMIPRQGHMDDGRLATRRVGPHHPGQQVEASFIYPDDRSTFVLRLFLSPGQRSAYHAAMAVSSRWVARTSGRCGLQPSCRRSRPT
jgi:hypothetical protein